MSSTSGNPTRFTDKTLIMYAQLVNNIKNGSFDKAFKFEPYDYDNSENIITVKHKGCYLIVDNGYLKWSVTVPPMKTTT